VADYRSARYIDDRVAAALERVVALKRRAAEIDAETALVSGELSAIASDQARIRENLKSIGEGHDEKRLRATLVEKLIAQERRLEELTASHRSLQEERQRVQSEIDAGVADLEFEATI
jgi:chromosome segregation ATPase